MLKENQDIQVLPGKGVYTVNPGGKRKCRLVACGNFSEPVEDQALFASGTDAVGLRIAIREAARRVWKGDKVHVKCAFLRSFEDGGLGDGEREPGFDETTGFGEDVLG